MPDAETFSTLARKLYAGSPESFVARRREAVTAARSSGHFELAQDLGSLRRPSIAAAHINGLTEPTRERISDLARRLREATRTMDVGQLKSLGTERANLVSSIVEPLNASKPVMDEVRATVLAALADPQAEAAVRSGTLVRALSYSGFGEVDLSDAVGAPALRLVVSTEELARARADVKEAQRRVNAAKDAVDAAHKAWTAASVRLEQAQERLTRLHP